jgi:hypothetical protein
MRTRTRKLALATLASLGLLAGAAAHGQGRGAAGPAAHPALITADKVWTGVR